MCYLVLGIIDLFLWCILYFVFLVKCDIISNFGDYLSSTESLLLVCHQCNNLFLHRRVHVIALAFIFVEKLSVQSFRVGILLQPFVLRNYSACLLVSLETEVQGVLTQTRLGHAIPPAILMRTSATESEWMHLM